MRSPARDRSAVSTSPVYNVSPVSLLFSKNFLSPLSPLEFFWKPRIISRILDKGYFLRRLSPRDLNAMYPSRDTVIFIFFV